MAGLNEFVQRLQRIGAGEINARIGAAVADAAKQECLAGFDQQRDPYGVPWAQRKSGGYWPLLNKTGAGKASLTAVPFGDMVRMSIRGYFQYHQEGTRYMVARRPFPEQSRGLGTWREPAERAAVNVVLEAMR